MDFRSLSVFASRIFPLRFASSSPDTPRRFSGFLWSAGTICCLLLSGCAGMSDVAGGGKASQIIISIRDQKMTVLREGGGRVSFPISTSKFGLGDRRRSYTTPTGTLEVAQKIGGGAPVGAVFHGRVRTGEIVKVNAPGRDPIVTRILALRGLEEGNRDAESRGIYIHGTPEERLIGQPVSYGCIRMRSRDVIQLYDMVGLHTKVRILNATQNSAVASYAPRPVAPASSSGTLVSSSGSNSAVAIARADAEAGESTATTTTSVTVSPATTTVASSAASARSKQQGWAGSPARLLADGTSSPTTPSSRTTHRTTGDRPAASVHPVVNQDTENSSSSSTASGRNSKRPSPDSL